MVLSVFKYICFFMFYVFFPFFPQQYIYCINTRVWLIYTSLRCLFPSTLACSLLTSSCSTPPYACPKSRDPNDILPLCPYLSLDLFARYNHCLPCLLLLPSSWLTGCTMVWWSKGAWCWDGGGKWCMFCSNHYCLYLQIGAAKRDRLMNRILTLEKHAPMLWPHLLSLALISHPLLLYHTFLCSSKGSCHACLVWELSTVLLSSAESSLLGV